MGHIHTLVLTREWIAMLTAQLTVEQSVLTEIGLEGDVKRQRIAF